MDNLIDRLRELRLFRGVTPEDLSALLQAMTEVKYPAGRLLFEKGAPGDAMYMVLAGRVRIFTRDALGNEITLSYMEPVRIFGDFSLLDNSPRSASAMIDQDCTLLRLSAEDFAAFLPKHPSVGVAMVRNMAEQVRHITSYLSKASTAMELVAQGNYEAALNELAADAPDDDVQKLTSTLVEMVQAVREKNASNAANTTGVV